MTIVRPGATLVLFLAGLLLAPSYVAAEVVSGGLRVDDPLYRELRLAADLGLLRGPLHHRDPLSRAAAFRLLDGIADVPLERREAWGMTRSVGNRLARASRRLAPPEAWSERRYIAGQDVIGDQKMSMQWSDITRGRSAPRYLDMGYTQHQGFSLESDHAGYRDGNGYALDYSGRIREDGHALTYRPLVATARVGWRGVRLVAGREPLRWGPDNYGNLLLSENARPLDQVRLESDAPFRLPGPARRVGELHVGLLAGRLDDPNRRDAPNPWLAGARISWAPVPWLVLGATRTSLLDGKGNGFVLNPGTIWDLILASQENEVGDRRNDTDQKAMLEGNLYLWPLFRPIPILDGGRFWFELGGEDSPQHGIFPASTGSTYGIEIVARGIVVRGEATALRDDRNLWYWHRIYTDGYTYRGRVMGHPAGGDSRAQSYGVDVPIGTWGLATVTLERQEIGFYANPGVPPTRSVPPILHGVQDTWKLRVEKALDRGDVAGYLSAEIRALRRFGSNDRLGPLEQWGVTVAWRR